MQQFHKLSWSSIGSSIANTASAMTINLLKFSHQIFPIKKFNVIKTEMFPFLQLVLKQLSSVLIYLCM